jgi:hypothetical protein
MTALQTKCLDIAKKFTFHIHHKCTLDNGGDMEEFCSCDIRGRRTALAEAIYEMVKYNEPPNCTSEVCCLSGEKREIGPCKFLRITGSGREDCCPY